MIRAEQIPDEVVEAAAQTAYAQWVSLCVMNGGVEDEYRTWIELEYEERDEWRDHARASIAAALSAWPGVTTTSWFENGTRKAVLNIPLPLEVNDD